MALFEEGNQAAAKGRTVEKLIERINLQEDSKRLREGLEKLMDKVADGDQRALEFVTDRLDGKAKQTVDANVTGDLNITKIERSIVDPANRNA
jgi:hypothetical protein